MPGNDHVWHLYVVRLEERDRLLADLARRGVTPGSTTRSRSTCSRPSPTSVISAGDFPNAEEAAGRLLSLPMHPHLTADDQVRIAEVIKEELA